MPTLSDLLDAAVCAVGGVERAGQVEMAEAVQRAIDSREHLLVQAGTGTGKSLAYLVPAVASAVDTGRPVVVATATLALQGQIIDRDLPSVASALTTALGRRPTYALVKGRANYLCRHKVAGGFPDLEQDALLEVAQVDTGRSALEQEVLRVRQWADETASGDRDDLVPGVSRRAWRQVSVTARECLGQRCPMVAECFVEQARARAREVDIVVTNHAFMAIDAFENRSMLPEHDVLVIDEGHELVDRVTSTVTGEVTAGTVRAAARAASRYVDSVEELEDAALMLETALADVPPGRLTAVPDAVDLALVRTRDLARSLSSQLKPEGPADNDGGRQQARAAVAEVFDIAERLLEGRELDVPHLVRDERRGSVLRVAPMSVAAAVREHVFTDRTVVLTSATLELGGSFDALAGTIGLRGQGAPAWHGLDVGSPFDYRSMAVAYVAAHLPPPGREGLAEATLDEIEALVRAAGGRTLGLFSSMRAARQATEAMRERFDGTALTVACQGEDQVTTLVRDFARTAQACLFGTLTLWQGVDVPGSACQLVIIDRIPFPRPDDPLASARTQAIGRMGGNGFMAVSATHAALRLAQGAGRLIRRGDDRGVVAFLDPRLVTARYAGFLQASLPPFWPTTDRATALGALSRLDAAAAPVRPVAVPAERGAGAEAAGTGAGGSDPPVASNPPTPASSRSAVTAGYGWTAEQDEELRDGLDLGVGLDEIADQVERPVDAVHARIAALGLTVSRDQGVLDLG